MDQPQECRRVPGTLTLARSVVFAPLAVLASIVLATPGVAGVWNEQGDATDLPPGQATIGEGELTTINGTIWAPDADMFCISVPDPSAFSASTCAGWNCMLFLFHLDGMGISFNDDYGGGNCVGHEARVTGIFLPGPGTYLLAISDYDWYPWSVTGPIWESYPWWEEVPPNGPGALDPVVEWDGFGFDPEGPYRIDLTGAEFCEAPTPVETSSWGRIKATYR